jgi:hypothetical protein
VDTETCMTDRAPSASPLAKRGARRWCEQRAALHLPATALHQLFPQRSMARGGSANSRLLCICRPPAALLHATARRGGAPSGEMGGGASGGLHLMHPDYGDATSSSGGWGGGGSTMMWWSIRNWGRGGERRGGGHAQGEIGGGLLGWRGNVGGGCK